MTSFQIQALITFLAPFAIQFAKASQSKVLSWVNANTTKVNMSLSVITSILTNAGVAVHHVTAGQISINYPDLPTAIHGLTGFAVMTLVQFLGQATVYEHLVRHIAPVKK